MDGGRGHCVGEDQQQNEDMEPGHLEHPLEEGRGKAAWLVLINRHHLPAIRVPTQHLIEQDLNRIEWDSIRFNKIYNDLTRLPSKLKMAIIQ